MMNKASKNSKKSTSSEVLRSESVVDEDARERRPEDEVIDVEIDEPEVSLGDWDEDDEPLDEDEAKDSEDQGAKGRYLPALAKAKVPESLTALNVYLAKLKHVEILPLEEQAELAVKFQETGDKEAAARLVASNLRLVVKIAFQFRRQWADVMDLVAEGNLGLAEAIRKFDAERGIPFPSYARFWIRARILAFIQENKHLIHAGSRAARKLFWRLERERRYLQNEGQEVTTEALAERIGVTEQDIHELAPIMDQRPVSMDVPIGGEEEGRTRGETMADPEAGNPESFASESQLQEQIKRVFAAYRETLEDRDRAIWDKRLQADAPVRLEDLGNEFGVSKERVRQLEVRIKSRLKEFVERHLGEDILIEILE